MNQARFLRPALHYFLDAEVRSYVSANDPQGLADFCGTLSGHTLAGLIHALPLRHGLSVLKVLPKDKKQDVLLELKSFVRDTAGAPTAH